MRAAIYLLPLLISTTLAAPQERCPDGCKCTITPTSEYMARCTSLESIDFKKHPSITALDLSNLNIEALPPKLRKMKGLRELDLSGNQFTTLKNFPKLNKLTHLSLRDNQLTIFDAKNLPNSIVDLDLSHNQITHFMGLTKLPKLKTLRLEGNAIECDCPFASHIEIILNKFEVTLEDLPKCSSPSNLQGVLVSRVYCVNGAVLFDEDTLNDEPIEDEYMPSKVDSSTESEDEGSGSGDGDFIVPSDPDVPNCFYNCSTAAPISEDESLPRADIGKEIVDVFRGTTTQKDEEEPPMGDPVDDTPSRDPVDETVVISTSVRKVSATPGKEVPPQEGSEKESPRAAVPAGLPTQSEPKKSNATTYIIVGALLVVMVALIAYVVIKKKKNQGPQGEILDKVPPVEMKPLMSKPNGNDATTLAERTPLMNGQNGHTENGDAVKQADMPENQVEVRPKADDDGGVIPERVTITAKELSSPKSPVLVQRRLEDDGRIVDHIVDPGKS